MYRLAAREHRHELLDFASTSLRPFGTEWSRSAGGFGSRSGQRPVLPDLGCGRLPGRDRAAARSSRAPCGRRAPSAIFCRTVMSCSSVSGSKVVITQRPRTWRTPTPPRRSASRGRPTRARSDRRRRRGRRSRGSGGGRPRPRRRRRRSRARSAGRRSARAVAVVVDELGVGLRHGANRRQRRRVVPGDAVDCRDGRLRRGRHRARASRDGCVR